MRSPSDLHIVSDFDGTLIAPNSAARLIKHYLRKGREPFHRRLALILPLLTPHSRREHFSRYYDCLRRIPARERHAVLARIDPNPRWMDAVRALKMKRKVRTVRLTILSRNCVDVVNDWLLQNKEAMRRAGIRVEAIIANRSLDSKGSAIVRERGDLKHVDYVGFGDLQAGEKLRFITRKTIYIGDREERMLKPLVKEFIGV